MNCFAHAFRFLADDPYFLAGTLLPDWLVLVDRKVRVRTKRASAFTDDPSPSLRQLAHGILQHHADDDWFHNTRGFVELNLEFAKELREMLGAEAGFRPHLVGHVVIEMLLDAFLAERDLDKLDLLYARIRQVDPAAVQQHTNAISVQTTAKMTQFIPLFIEEAYLYDYLDNQRTRYRMNRVLARVKLPALPENFLDWLPSARKRVYINANRLLRYSEFFSSTNSSVRP